MSCKKYNEQDNCPYYPTDCYNCECSYSYTRTDEEIEADESEVQNDNYQKRRY